MSDVTAALMHLDSASELLWELTEHPLTEMQMRQLTQAVDAARVALRDEPSVSFTCPTDEQQCEKSGCWTPGTSRFNPECYQRLRRAVAAPPPETTP